MEWCSIAKSKILLIIWLLTLSFYTASCTSIHDFHTIWPWLYKSDGLYNVDIGVEVKKDSTGHNLFKGLVVLAIGDVDDNKHNDIITISDDQSTLTIFFYSEHAMDFKRYNSIDLNDCKAGAANVIPAPPYKIALVWTENHDYDYIKLLQDVSDSHSVLSTNLMSLKLEKGSQPMFIDLNSDSYTDIVFNTNSNSTDGIIKVSLYNYNSKLFETDTTNFFDDYVYENNIVGWKDITNELTLKLSSPHFSTLTDVNADWIADLYMTLKEGDSDTFGFMMIATRVRSGNKQSIKYWLVDEENLSNSSFTSPLFADFDNDGTVDKAFYNTSSNSIQIFYNERGSRGAGDSSLCRSIPTITGSSPSGLFKGYSIFSLKRDTIKINNADGLYTHPDLLFIPGQLRTGDIDVDGDADIIITIKTNDGTSKTLILVNKECPDESNWYRRTFDSDNDYSRISNYKNTKYGFLMDFDNDGVSDFVVITEDEEGNSSVLAFYNNYSRDSYYISASTYTHSTSSYGDKVHGINYRGIYTSLSDHKHAFMSQQLTRTSYAALQDTMGSYAIGRSNNYIEDFTLSYHHQKVDSDGEKSSLEIEKKVWTPIIPNSYLLIDIHDLDSGDWKIKLLINPTDSFLLVGIIVSLILTIMGGFIIYMHMQEKKEDKQHRNPNLDFF